MNPLKKGPEIKLSELRVPQVLEDLYFDLRERHLLPVVVLLIVGIVAVPLLLGGSSGSEEAPPPVAGASGGTARPTSSIVVSKEAPALRDYKRRLEHLSAEDPFVQQYTQPEETGAGEGSSESSLEGESAPPPGESVPGESGGSPAPTDPGDSGLRHYTYTADVRIVPVSVDGKPSKADPYVRRDLPPLTMLPSRSIPALTYMGTTKDGKKSLMLVSSDVTALFGDSTCVVGSQTCQLLALEPGLPQTVVYGPNARTYRIELLEVHLTVTDELNKAPLGKPRGRGDG